MLQATEDFFLWVNLFTNVASGDFVDLVDADAPNYPHRFYRTVFYEAAGEFGTVTRETVGSVSFRLNGLNGRSYVLQASTNMKDWTNVAAGGTVLFTLAPEPGVPHRFFRVQSR